MGTGNPSDATNGFVRVDHCIDPVYDTRSEVLVLGTMPSPASREAAFFYGHPRNRFWPLIAVLFDEPVPETNAERTDLLLRHHIALWDVLASCDIQGASDASITNAQPNDLHRIFETASIKRVFCTGAVATRLYRQFCEPSTKLPATQLPSTSSANTSWSMARLAEAYRPLASAAFTFDPPVLDVTEMTALEHRIAQTGTPLGELMRRAGRFLAFEALKLLAKATTNDLQIRPNDIAAVEAKTGDSFVGKRAKELNPFDIRMVTQAIASSLNPIVILCGTGNNGGDGWVAAEYFANWGLPLRVITPIEPREISAEPAHTAAIRAQKTLGRRNIKVAPSNAELMRLINDAPMVIDALLGTGFCHNRVREPINKWIRAINHAHTHGTLVVAADIPSGLSGQTGHAAPETTHADLTVTMIAPKSGLATEGVAAYCGQIEVASIAYIESFLP